MKPEIGQNISMKYKGRSINAEVVGAELLNPQDRRIGHKRDINLIYKVTVRIPELKMLLNPQIEMTDAAADNINETLSELIRIDLAMGHGQPYGNA